MLNFRECTLAKLDDEFGLEEMMTSQILQDWLDFECEISDFERQTLKHLKRQLLFGVRNWNETELSQRFIGPIFSLVDFSSKKFNLFAERSFSGTVDGVEIGGNPDGMIASGYREPKQPYFCFQEYKKLTDPKGDPAGQTLAAMLVAQAINEHEYPVYGCYIIGQDWFFITLEGKIYCISPPYVAIRDDIFDIFRILKVLKQMITELID